MSYSHLGCGDIFKQRLESCFTKKGSLPPEDQLQSALEICMLRESSGPLYQSLDERLDKASEMISSDSFWPSVSFTHDPTSAGVAMKPHDSGKPVREISERLKDTIKDEQLIHDIRHGECVVDTGNSFSRAYKMADNMRWTIVQAFNDWQVDELDSLLGAAASKGYSKVRDQFELAEEITRRREQYPGDRIYAFIGNEIGDFFRGMYDKGKPQWRGAYMIHHGNRWGSKLNSYSSFVVAKSQVETAQLNEGAWASKRGARRWEYGIAIAHRFKMNLADYPGTSRKIIKDCSMGKLF